MAPQERGKERGQSIHSDPQPAPPQNPVWKRLGWFVLLYAGGVLAVAIVALIFRVLVLNAVR